MSVSARLARLPLAARAPRAVPAAVRFLSSATPKPAPLAFSARTRVTFLTTTTTTTNAPTCFRGLATASDSRVVIDGADGTVAVGPGYVSYSGPAPGSEKGVLDSASSVITYARLRDCCPCERCIHPSTRQKTHTSGEAAREVAAFGNEVLDARTLHAATNAAGERGIEVHWPVHLDGAEHSSFYPLSLLRRLSSQRVRGHTYLNDTLSRRLWTADELAKSPDLWIKYEDLHGGAPGERLSPRPEVQLRLLEQLQLYGLAFVRGLPTDLTDNKDCRLREFAETIGGLRNTFYGETWDVKSVVNSKNVAYTNLNLGLHMDLLYFALPPRFQFLHSLRNRVIGGASYFVDSFAAGKALERERPELYASLQRNVLEYEYDNDNHYMTFQHAVLPQKPLDGADLHTVINWSPPFQAPNVRPVTDSAGTVPSDPTARAAAEAQFYEALSAFQETLDRPEFRYEFTLQEGDIVLFDNQRVLHARTAFRDKTDDEVRRDGTVIVPGEPTRWLKGCYLDGSTVWDKLAVLNDQVRGIPK